MAAKQATGVPEFHVVIKRPSRRGPLAPYRFAIVVVFALVVAGRPLWDATETGVGIDAALIRIGVAALFAWIVVGRINKILAAATPTGTGRATSPGAAATGDQVTPPSGS